MSNFDIVDGEILIDEVSILDKATIYIRIEDTSRADTSSEIIFEKILTNVIIGSQQSKHAIPFSLSIPSVQRSDLYTVSVHIDTNGNGKLDEGDYINMESYPLPLRGSKDKLSITAKKVK